MAGPVVDIGPSTAAPSVQYYPIVQFLLLGDCSFTGSTPET